VPNPLVRPAWRAPLIAVAAAAAAGFTALAVTVAGGASTSFDTWTFRELDAHVPNGAAATLLALSWPGISIGLVTLVVVFAVRLRRWDVALLAVLGPGLTMLLTEVVFKPLLDREFVIDESTLSGVFPSGHESAVASCSLVLAIVAYQLPIGRRLRNGVLAALGVWTVVAALGLVRNFWHYATDTIGAICLSGAVVLTVALVIDSASATARPQPQEAAGAGQR
jgi:undecaprenyl-diphosphatase